MGRYVPISALTTRAPFADIFPVSAELVEAIRSHMRSEGLDEGAPIIVWPEGERLTVVDGHTRLRAAVGVPLADVYIHEHEFADEDAAFDYAIHNQRDRRNLEPPELLRLITRVDEHLRKPKGGNNPYGRAGKPEVGIEVSGETSIPQITAKQTAERVGTSTSMVNRARVIAADPVAVEAVQSGMSLSSAAEAAYSRKRGESVAFPSLNGEAMPNYDDEPWFKAKSAGSIVESKLRIALREVRELLDGLERQGIVVSDLMSDRRVSATWSGKAENGALGRANELAGLIRDAIRG